MANTIEAPQHSYEQFAQQPFYQDVNRALLGKLSSIVTRVTDLATGTGATIEHLFELGKVNASSRIIGIDVDREGLETARRKFEEQNRRNVLFVEGNAEVPPIADGSVDVVTVFNSIHLMDPQRVFVEASRMLRVGGLFLANTAYEKLHALPEGTQRMWGTLVSLARRELEDRYGITNVPNPMDLRKHTVDDFREMALDAGLGDIATEEYTAYMDREAVRAICDYREFAEGTLPGVPIEIATEVLVNAVDPMFEKLKSTFDRLVGREAIPRNWMFLVARKVA